MNNAGRIDSKKLAALTIERSLTRVLIPFSYSGYFATEEKRVAAVHAERARIKRKPARWARRAATEVRRAAFGPSAAETADYYELIADKLLSEKEARGEDDVWRPMEKGKLGDLESVFLPPIVKALVSRQDSRAEVLTFYLNEDVQHRWLGEGLFITSQAAARKIETRKALELEQGFPVLLKSVRLYLFSSGVGVWSLDLHLADPENGEPALDDAFRQRLLSLGSRCQYLPSDFRLDLEPHFHPSHPAFLTASNPILQSFPRELIAGWFPEFLSFAFGERAEAAARGRAESFLKAFATAALEADDADRRSLFQHLLGWNSAPADLMERLVDAARANVHAGLPMPAESEGAWKAAVSGFPAWCFGRGAANAVASTGRIPDPWGTSDFLSGAFAKLGIRYDATTASTLFLTSGRAFIYSHIRVADNAAVDTIAPWAGRMARLHDATHDEATGGAEDRRVRLFESLEYHAALEGVAVVQSPGRNPDRADALHAVRERQFMLVLLALGYRMSLLNFTFTTLLGRTSAGKPGGSLQEQVEPIRRLNRRVERFTHFLYKSHVSNMTHLQHLFDALCAQMNVKELWADVDRDVSQYLERQRQILDQVKKGRADKVAFLGSLLASVFTVDKLFALLRSFGMADFKSLSLPAKLGAVALFGTCVIVFTLMVRRYIQKPAADN